MGTDQPIVYKSRSFLSTLAWGASGVVMLVVMSGAAIILYGMNIADRKVGSVFELVEAGIENLPALQKVLPPPLADILSDQRRPDYAGQVEVSVKLASAGGDGAPRPILEVNHQGSELITLLSVRVVLLNEQGEPVAERNEWVATPIAADKEWRGPLFPKSNRLIPCGSFNLKGSARSGSYSARVEISDLRLWKASKPTQVLQSPLSLDPLREG